MTAVMPLAAIQPHRRRSHRCPRLYAISDIYNLIFDSVSFRVDIIIVVRLFYRRIVFFFFLYIYIIIISGGFFMGGPGILDHLLQYFIIIKSLYSLIKHFFVIKYV